MHNSTKMTHTNSEEAQVMELFLKRSYRQSQKYLNLYNCREWLTVMKYQDWSHLVNLLLSRCGIDDNGAQQLGKLRWPNLQTLIIQYNQISSSGLQKLLSQGFPKLKKLLFYDNNIGDLGAQILFSSQNLPELQILRVGENKITSLAPLPDTQLNRLRKLWLSENVIGNKGAKLLIKADLPFLETLELYECQLGNEGTRQLTKGNWPKLSQLWINKKHISYEGCSAITSNNWKELSKICICWQSDSTGPIGILCLVATIWAINLQANYNIGECKMEGDVEMIVINRFPCSDIEQ